MAFARTKFTGSTHLIRHNGPCGLALCPFVMVTVSLERGTTLHPFGIFLIQSPETNPETNRLEKFCSPVSRLGLRPNRVQSPRTRLEERTRHAQRLVIRRFSSYLVVPSCTEDVGMRAVLFRAVRDSDWINITAIQRSLCAFRNRASKVHVVEENM